MCGIVMVKSQHTVPLNQHLEALKTIEARGPDFVRYHYSDHTFVAQSVLHITGTDTFYHTARDDFFAFNGEIYNYQQFGPAGSDIDVAYQAARDNVARFRDFTGPWAWALLRNNVMTYATDPQGERVLYQYQDDDWLIVASEVTAIQHYIQAQPDLPDYNNKCWTMLRQTPWQGIERLEPGQLYCDGKAVSMIDSIWSWIKPSDISADEAQEEFQSVWRRVCQQLQPNCTAAISYSAGIDSNLIMASMEHQQLIAIDCVGKDPVVAKCQDFLSSHELAKLRKIDLDPETWAQLYHELLQRTAMPAQSWSFVGKYAVAANCDHRVLFTGLAADELFGGYSVYQTLQYDSHRSHSPYSRDDHDQLWQQCMHSYDNDARQATLLMDYWYQVVGVDAPGQDRIAGAWGIETRNPFMHQDIMRLALNLPWHLKVNTETKPILKNQFRKLWPEHQVLPKMGFAGHANDSMPWLSVRIDPTGDRHQDWIQIAQRTFANHIQTS
jgi:asparagine synthetase B (glutamine-hydrolysing)